jgi:hypothetical protein
MQIRSSTTMIPVLATILASAVVQATGAPFPGPKVTAPGTLPRAQLAVLQAPIGHRQPTLDDLPPWLRQKEKPGPEANPTQDSQAGGADAEQRGRRNEQRRAPRIEPNEGVPRICAPC